jgi:hypothetical protein
MKINFLDDDEIRKKLDCIYDDKVGNNYETLILKEIFKESEYRYASKIPPGFEDKKKTTGNPYGDLILWFQMMDYSKKMNVPIIFVTDEEKKDWWLTYKINNKKELIGPLPQLIKEFSLTGQEFYMYRFSDFLSNAKEYLEVDVESEIIDAVKDIEKLEDLEEELDSIGIGSTNMEAPYINTNMYEMIKKQQELINSGGISAVQQVAKMQQDIINSGGINAVQEMVRKQQELINSGAMVKVSKTRKKSKKGHSTKDTSKENEDN